MGQRALTAGPCNNYHLKSTRSALYLVQGKTISFLLRRAKALRVDLKKGEDVMRRYGKNGQLETVICNRCGKKMVVERGILREGALMLDHSWDFFSEKDGEVHHIDICESCYDDWVDQFKIAVEVEEQTELL